MKNLFKAVLGTATIAIVLAANVSAKAQTPQAVVVGSSALATEAGQATILSSSIGATCVYTRSGSAAAPTTSASALDGRTGVPAASSTDYGNLYITWTPGGSGCASPDATVKIWTYLSTDSTVGVRCFFANPKCTLQFGWAAGSAPAGSNRLQTGITSTITETALPSGIQTALAGQPFTAAATDIRPEDAKFATVRALTACGTPVTPNSQYLGLGYATSGNVGSQIQSFFATASSAPFNVLNFNVFGTDPFTSAAIPAFKVVDAGAAPIVVVVNPGLTGGFGSLLVQNISRNTLAGYLDGTYGHTNDVIPQVFANSGNATTVIIREPLSGTYNTMEYNVANRVDYTGSQDVGVNAVNAAAAGQAVPVLNCAGGVTGGLVNLNPLNESIIRASGTTSKRQRAIGTGEELAEVRLINDSLGYGFWSAGNFGGFSGANGKYLTVDGVDPIQEVWQGGLIPTAGNGQIGNVTLANVKNGSYPIWSKLRFVTSSTDTFTATLVNAAQNFLSPTQPDFVPVSSLFVLRSHFAPPTVAFSGTNVPANGGNAAGCTTAEIGGDVGGQVLSAQADGAYCKDNLLSTGQTGLRQ